MDPFVAWLIKIYTYCRKMRGFPGKAYTAGPNPYTSEVLAHK
jgi:hypothetical protein